MHGAAGTEDVGKERTEEGDQTGDEAGPSREGAELLPADHVRLQELLGVLPEIGEPLRGDFHTDPPAVGAGPGGRTCLRVGSKCRYVIT